MHRPWTLTRLRDHVGRGLATLENPPSRVVLAFSGGADSTALLLALLHLEPALTAVIAHVDHRLDPLSGCRALHALKLAHRLTRGAEGRFEILRLDAEPVNERLGLSPSSRGDGVEAIARRIRYSKLEKTRKERQADLILTGHHANDQLETLVLRLQQGTRLFGLSGIQRHRGHLFRPLLALGEQSGPSRDDLELLLKREGVEWVVDPTNNDLAIKRNSVRHQVLPRLIANESVGQPGHPEQITFAANRVAAKALAARTQLDKQFARLLRIDTEPHSASFDLTSWLALPSVVQDQALDALHRAAGLHRTPSQAAKAELQRQIEWQINRQIRMTAQPSSGQARSTTEPTALSCSCGRGWSWRVDPAGSSRQERRIRLLRSDLLQHPSPAPFTYTLSIPGITQITEIDVGIEARWAAPQPWMLQSWPQQVALFQPKQDAVITVRNRTRGDTFQPFGSSQRIKIKKLLIDRKVPRAQRDALPIVCVDDEIAWVAGITLAEPFRLPKFNTIPNHSLLQLRLKEL